MRKILGWGSTGCRIARRAKQRTVSTLCLTLILMQFKFADDRGRVVLVLMHYTPEISELICRRAHGDDECLESIRNGICFSGLDEIDLFDKLVYLRSSSKKEARLVFFQRVFVNCR
jgi:hypothetical protein